MNEKDRSSLMWTSAYSQKMLDLRNVQIAADRYDLAARHGRTPEDLAEIAKRHHFLAVSWADHVCENFAKHQ